ncbi:MAG TPA: hypothetical protein ENN69_03805 [Spirochaetia bacterium]|nr:hypothetical protein [Spirochaetia bacterium]
MNLHPSGAARVVCVIILLFSTGMGFAQEPGPWRESRTEHLVFIYRETDREAARELTGCAEEVYQKVTAFFDHFPDEVRCVLVGEVDLANGMYVPVPHHLRLYLRAPTGPWMGARTESWLRILLLHELTHYVDMKAGRGLFYVLSLLFGEGAQSGAAAFLPPWTYEGIAVTLETEFSRGGRGRNPFFLLPARAFLLDDVPLTLGHLEYASPYPPPSRYYLFGYLFIDYLRRTYGPDVYQKIRDRFLSFPLAGPWAALRAVTGKHQDRLWEEMREDLAARWGEDAPQADGRAFTPATIADYHAPVLAAGNWFLYREAADRAPAVILLDPETGVERVLLEMLLTDDHSFNVSADGRTLVWAAADYRFGSLDRYRVTSDLYLADIEWRDTLPAAARHSRRLTQGLHLWHPVLSPDGKRLFAVQGVGSFSRLVEVHMENGSVSVLYEESGADVYHPRISPDGGRLVFVRNLRGLQDIFLCEVGESRGNTNSIRPLFTIDRAGDYYPRFSDTDTVLFTSDREETLAVYSVRVDGTRLTRLLQERIGAFDAVMTDAGLVYASYRKNGYCLRIAGTDEISPLPLPRPPTESPAPPFPRPEMSSRPYVDLPEFQLWLPNAGLMNLDGAWHVAVGAYVYFASFLGTTVLDASVLYYPSLEQPAAVIRFTTEAGPFDLSYTAFHTYQAGYSGTTLVFQERFGQQLVAALPLVNGYSGTAWDYVALFAGLAHTYLLENDDGFLFLNGFAPGAVATGNIVAPLVGISMSHIPDKGAAAFFPPWAVKLTLSGTAPLPLFAETASGISVQGRGSFSLPGLWPLSSFSIGLAAGYTSPALLGTATPAPRGLFPAESQEETGRVLAALDYRFTVAYTDAPLVAGFHLDGLGAGVHGEMIAEFDPAAGRAELDPYLYTGVELIILGGIGNFSLPIGIGLAARFDATGSRSFDPGRDIAVYYFFSLDSFFFAAENTVTGASGYSPE